jgi:hypothetical protein
VRAKEKSNMSGGNDERENTLNPIAERNGRFWNNLT